MFNVGILSGNDQKRGFKEKDAIASTYNGGYDPPTQSHSGCECGSNASPFENNGLGSFRTLVLPHNKRLRSPGVETDGKRLKQRERQENLSK